MVGKVRKIVAGVALLAAILVLCPLPQPVQLTMQGSRTDADGTTTAAEMNLKGWKLNYLVRVDQLRGTFTIAGDSEEILNVKVVAPVITREGTGSVWFDHYDPQRNEMLSGLLIYSEEQMEYQDELGNCIAYANR